MERSLTPNTAWRERPDAELKTCRGCGTIGYEKDEHCPRCGRRFGENCRHCGNEIEHPVALHCATCGERLDDPDAATAGGPTRHDSNDSPGRASFMRHVDAVRSRMGSGGTGIVSMLLFLLGVVLGGSVATAQTVSITKSVEPATNPMPSGQPFVYTIAYSWSGGAPGTIVVEDVLAPSLEYISATNVATGSQIKALAWNPGTRTVTFTISGVDLAAPSGGGTVQINVKFPQGSTCDGTVASNSARIRLGSSSSWETSNFVETVAEAANKWEFSKSVFLACTVDSTVVYRLAFWNPGGYGLLDLNNVAIQDLVPAGATIVNVVSAPAMWNSASGANLAPNQAVLPAVFSPSWYEVYVTVKYPRPTFAAGQWVTNTANVSFTLPCDSTRRVFTDRDSSQICSESLSGAGILGKGMLLGTYFPWNSYYLPALVPGCCAQYSLYYRNAGNVPHNNLLLTDEIPPEVDVKRVYAWVPAGNSVTVTFYTYSGGSCGTAMPATYTTSQWITAPPGPICKVEWSYANPIAPNAEWHNFIDFCVRPNRYTDLSAVLPGDNITNLHLGTASTSAGPMSEIATHIKAVDALGPKLVLTKQFIGECGPNGSNPNGPYYPGMVVRYRIAVANLGNAPATGLVISDLLPNYLTFAGNVNYNFSTFTSPVTNTNPSCTVPPMTNTVQFPMSAPTQQPAIGDQSLTWRFPDLPSRCDGAVDFFTIDFDVTISAIPPAPYGQYDNAFTVTADNAPTQTSPTVTFVVNRIVAYTVRKEVREKGSGDDFAESATIGQGETAEYRLTLSNTGNAPLVDVCLLDIMPHAGDIQVINTSPVYPSRGSTIDMPLAAAVTTVPVTGYSVEYLGSLASSKRPDRLSFCGSYCAPTSGVVNPTNPAPVATTTSTTFAPTFSYSVRALPGTTLLPGADLEVFASAAVPATAVIGDVACNSFAVRVTDSADACMQSEASACITVTESDSSQVGGCIDFEDSTVSNWYGYFLNGIATATDVAPYGTVLQVTDGPGGSIAVDNADFAGNWLELADAECLCFDYKVDWNSDVSTTVGSAPKISIYTGAPLTAPSDLSTNHTYATFIGSVSNPLIEDNVWQKFCLPLGPAVNDVIPSNTYGSWLIVQNGVPLSGAAAANEWMQLITNVTGLVLYADYNSQPSEIVYFDNFCWNCPEEIPTADDCCDSVDTAPGDHLDVQISKLIITVHNNRPTPIDYIDVEYIDCATGAAGTPLQLNSGSLQAITDVPSLNHPFPFAAYHYTGPPPYIRVPLTGYSLTPAGSIVRQDRIVWDISANIADPTTWCIRLTIHHVGGEVCIETLAPWQPAADQTALPGGITSVSAGTSIYALGINIASALPNGRRVGFATVSLLDTTDEIIGGTGGVWEGSATVDTRHAVRGFVQSRRSGRFSLSVDSSSSGPLRVFIESGKPDRKPRTLVRLYDRNGRLLSSDTAVAQSAVMSIDPPDRIEFRPDDASIDVIAPNPATHTATVTFTSAKGGESRLELVDARGITVAVIEERYRIAGSHDVTYDVSGLTPGMYHLLLTTPSGRTAALFEVIR